MSLLGSYRLVGAQRGGGFTPRRTPEVKCQMANWSRCANRRRRNRPFVTPVVRRPSRGSSTSWRRGLGSPRFQRQNFHRRPPDPDFDLPQSNKQSRKLRPPSSSPKFPCPGPQAATKPPYKNSVSLSGQGVNTPMLPHGPIEVASGLAPVGRGMFPPPRGGDGPRPTRCLCACRIKLGRRHQSPAFTPEP